MRWCFVLLVACRPILVPVPGAVELFVDGSTLDDGDGSKEHPYKHLERALKAGATVHLATGLYSFSGTLPDLALEGPKSAVLYAEGEAPFVISAERARLKGISIQGGQWGIETQGAVEVEGVQLSGQRAGAIHLVKGRLKLERSSIEGTLPDSVGVRAEPGTHLEVDRAGFRGSLARALDLTDADTVATDVASLGPRFFIHAVGGTTKATHCIAEQGAGTAFAVSRGRLEVRQCEVKGHEYGVLAGDDSDLIVDGLKSEGAQIAAVAIVKSVGSVRHLVAHRPGTHGAIESLESTTALEDISTSEGSELAIFVRHGTVTGNRIDVSKLAGEGDAIHVRDAKATFDHVKLSSISGIGVVSTAVADVTVKDLECFFCEHGAMMVERLSSLTATNVKTSSSPAATVGADGKLTLENLDFTGPPPAIWAECTGASKVIVRGRHPARELLSGACIEVL